MPGLLRYRFVFAVDIGWRVRYKVANEIHAIQNAVGPEISRKHLLTMYQNLAKDEEAQVREQATKNIVTFCATLREQYKELDDESGFETVFKEQIMPLVKTLYADPNNYVRAEIAGHVMSLTSLTNSSIARDEFIPLVKNSIEHEEYHTVKEIIARNLDSLIDVMGMPDIINSIQKLVEDLIYKSDSRWRIRRGVLLTFIHVSKKSEREFFDKNLKDIYVKLLYDPVFAVRKTAPLILPVLMKYFGTSWGYSLVPAILTFVEDNHYLYRYIPIFTMEEIINPTLDYHNVNGEPIVYLQTLKDLCYQDDEIVLNKAKRVLVKILTLQRYLKEALAQDWVKELTKHIEDEECPIENIRMYAEEMFDAFIANDKFSILDVTVEELHREDEDKTYLEATLYMCIKYFLSTIEKLLRDKVKNLPIRAKTTLSHIFKFSQKLEDECNEGWVYEVLTSIPNEEVAAVESKIKSRLNAVYSLNAFDEVELDFSLQDTVKDSALERQEEVEVDQGKPADEAVAKELDVTVAGEDATVDKE